MYDIPVGDVCDSDANHHTVENLDPGTIYGFSIKTVLHLDDGTVLYSQPATLRNVATSKPYLC